MPSLTSIIKQASRGADLYFVFRFLRILTMKWTATDAYKYKIIDKKGNALKKSSELESVSEKSAYTMLHRMVFKIRRLIEKVPLIGKSILLNYAAALFLLKEQKDTRVWTDEKYMTLKLMEFLETDWETAAEFLQEEIRNKYGKTSASEFLIEEVEIDEALSRKDQLKLALAKSKFKRSGGKVEKQPPSPAVGSNKYRGINFAVPKTKEDEKMAKDIQDYRKKMGKKNRYFPTGYTRVKKEEVEIDEGSSDTQDMYALMVKGLKAMPGSPKQKEIIKKINVIRKRMGMQLMKEDHWIVEKHGGFHVKKGQKWKHVKQFKNFKKYEKEEAPPGWEGTVKAMKKKKDITNPWALAWYMHNKGDKPHVPEGNELEEMQMENIKDQILSFGEFQLNEISMEAGKVYHQDTSDGPMYFKAVEQQKNKRWKGLVLDIGQKKPKNGSADEKLRFWKATPDKDVPTALKEEVEMEEAVNLKKLKKEYEDNEDKNNHTENYLLLAKAFGSSSDVKKVQEIMKRNQKQGSTSKSDMDWMYKNINKYYDKIRNEEVKMDERDEWKNTGIQAKNIFKMLKQKHKNDIPKMKSGLELILKQNKTKPDQEKIMWQEFNKYFKIKEEVKMDEAKGSAYPATIDTLRKIVKDKQHQTVMFKSGKAIVDTFTASAMVAVYDALKPALKKTFEKMITDKAGFMKTQAFAMKMTEGTEIEKSFIEEMKLDEEVPTVSTAGVAGLDTGLTFKKKKEDEKKAKILRKKLIGEIKMTRFAGKDVFIVNSEIYHACRLGKKQYAKYEKYVGKDTIGLAIREFGLKYPKRPIILQNGASGPMLYLKYGRS